MTTSLTADLIAAAGLPPRRQPRREPATVSKALLLAGMRATLDARPQTGPLRIFACGALMWERDAVPSAPPPVPARLRGFARRWCLRDIHNRGTPETPGLTLGLEPARDEACDGLLYTLPEAPAAEEEALWSVWRHEMPPGFYTPAWTRADAAPNGPAPALTFLAIAGHPLYAGARPEAEQATTLATAVGRGGANADYLRLTVETLAEHGMRDAATERLAERVAARLRAEARAGAA